MDLVRADKNGLAGNTRKGEKMTKHLASDPDVRVRNAGENRTKQELKIKCGMYNERNRSDEAKKAISGMIKSVIRCLSFLVENELKLRKLYF